MFAQLPGVVGVDGFAFVLDANEAGRAIAFANAMFEGALPGEHDERQVLEGLADEHQVEGQGFAGGVGLLAPGWRLDDEGVGDL